MVGKMVQPRTINRLGTVELLLGSIPEPAKLPAGPVGPGVSWHDIPRWNEARPRSLVTLSLLSATLDSVSSYLAILDFDGTVIAANARWHRRASKANLPLVDCSIGDNYLAVCEAATATSDRLARRATAGLRAVLRGRRRVFRLEFVTTGAKRKRRYFLMRAAWIKDRNVPFVVLTFSDISNAKRAQARLRQISAQIMTGQDDERRRIARDIHDTTLQNLVAARLLIDQILPGAGLDASATALRTAQMLIVHSMEELRTLSYLLHPPMLDELGLASAIRWYASGFEKRSGIRTTVEAPQDFARLEGDTETTLFRIVQEGLGNVHRHSGSRDARITLNLYPELIALEIADRGKGMSLHSSDSTNAQGAQIGVGIAGMRLRLQQLGGELEITSRNSGTTLRATVPRWPGRERGLGDGRFDGRSLR